MWPTFFIPPPSFDDFISGSPREVCGTATGTSVTIPNPSPINDGATQLLIIEYTTSNPVTTVDQHDPDWRRLFDSSRVPKSGSLFFGGNNQQIFWRIYNTGDPDAVVSVSTGGVYVAYTNIILNNPNTLDRWMQAYVHQVGDHPSGGTGGGRWDTPGTGLEVAQSGDLAIFTSAPCSAGGVPVSSNEPPAAYVEFSCTPTATVPGGGGIAYTIAGLQTRTRTANNKLKGCPLIDTTNWNIVGLSRGTASSGLTQLTCDQGTGRHYAEQSVTLEAGKTYLYAATYQGYGATNPSPVLWLTHIKPDGTEHGIGAKCQGGALDFAASTEVRWDTGVGKPTYGHVVPDNSMVGAGGIEISYLITPSVTGTYTLRIYVTCGAYGATPDDPPDVNSSRTNGNQWMQISGVVLQEGPATNMLPNYVQTTNTAAPVGSQAGVLLPVPWNTMTGAYAGWSYVHVRRSGGLRPVCKLFAPRMKGVSLDFNDTTILDTRERHGFQMFGYQALGSSHTVYEDLTNKKFYCELYVNSFGTGAADDAYSIGVCGFAGIQDTYNVSTVVGDWPGQYSYMSTGKTWTDGTQDVGTITGWSAGDYIGVGIDFTNWQVTYYRNGTLVKTQAITNDVHRHVLWMAQFGVRGPSTDTKQARFTYNFRGPFGGRKPAGFVAYDFDNEIP